jgi:predicted PurR-regulated permease PerM
VVLGVFCLIILYLIPVIGRELMDVLENSGTYQSKIDSFINKIGYDKLPAYIKEMMGPGIENLQEIGKEWVSEAIGHLLSFAGDIPNYALAPVFVYYFLTDTSFFAELLVGLIPVKVRDKSLELGSEIDKVIGRFIKSQLILSLIIAVLSLLVLMVFKIRFALIIALINGVTNMIPYFGPIIGLIPAIVAAASQSWSKVVIVTIAFFIIQQIESNLVSPRLVGDSIGMHPVFVMIVILLGGKYYGPIGMVLSVPIAGAVKVLVQYSIKFYNEFREE